VADVIEAASSGRAKCRGCARAIAKGAFRFGESLPNPYAEGEALYWFHVDCAALMRPEKFLASLDANPGFTENRDWLVRAAHESVEFRRLPRLFRAERASSGRAKCRDCHEPIANGSFRLVLQWFEDGRMSPMGYLHTACAANYFGTSDVLDRVVKLTPELGGADKDELAQLLRDQKPPREPSTTEESGPALAKTRAPSPPSEAATDSAPDSQKSATGR
jgi:hypothetical protein